MRSLGGVSAALGVERDMADELKFHIDARAADLAAVGFPHEEARRQARPSSARSNRTRTNAARQRGLRLFDDLRADLRYAVRTLSRTPAFAAMAIVSLALGIGANTVVFSVVNALVLQAAADRPIPSACSFVQSDSGAAIRRRRSPTIAICATRSVSFDGLIGYSHLADQSRERRAAPVRTWGYLATGNYFDVLGVKPALGRFFHQQDDLHAGEAPFAVLSYECWQGRFGGDPRSSADDSR